MTSKSVARHKKDATQPPSLTIFHYRRTQKISVGVVAPEYGLENVSYSLKPSDTQFVQLKCISGRRLDRRSNFWSQVPLVIGPRTDLLHTFNKLPMQKPIKRPYVVSAELELPRFLGVTKPWQMDWGLDALESNCCRAILALSEAAANYITKEFLLKKRPELVKKISVFRGGVAPGPTPKPRETTGALRLLFVGGDGLRKGMKPTIEAAEELRRNGLDLHLTIVGSANEHTYAVPNQKFSNKEVKDSILKNDWITHFESLSNQGVRKLMLESDLLVFPTVDESLGWVVIEAALSGLPVIASNIFAINELIVDGETGWLLPVPLDDDRRWRWIGQENNIEAWSLLQDSLKKGIVEIIEKNCDRLEHLYAVGKNARKSLLSLYHPETASGNLSKIYASALG